MFTTQESIIKTLTNLYWKAVRSVQAPNLIKNITYDKNSEVLEIFGFRHDLKCKKVYMVGAGKAVYHLAEEVEKLLGPKLKAGIISVPHGALEKCNPITNSVIKYFEGAKNNLPDLDAQSTTMKIVKLIEGLDEESFLLVLLTGGGSALLTLPVSPCTMDEKSKLVKDLSNAGADIIELNTVRKKISAIKGGKLSQKAYPSSIITLILPDLVINTPSFVGSGPTFEDNQDSSEAFDILRKYNLLHNLPASIKKILEEASLVNFPSDIVNEHYVIGNNIVAVESANDEAKTYDDCTSFVVSHGIRGDVDELCSQYCNLIEIITSKLNNSINGAEAEKFIRSLHLIHPTDEFIDELKGSNVDPNKNIILITSGEPTVHVKGSGRGGRSQQLALKFSSDYQSMKRISRTINDYDCYLLCAGTDGIDGPTDAAGAIGSSNLIEKATSLNLNPADYLENNDSYTFFEKFLDGMYHIKTGHTHTNVMDVHIMLIMPKNKKLQL